jgi:small-conductance mechanosensitive channel
MDKTRGKGHQWWTARRLGIRLAVCYAVLPLLFVPNLHAEPPSSDSGAPVQISGQTLFTIHTGLAEIGPTARAQAIETRLARLAQAPSSVIQRITVEEHELTSYVVTPDEVLFVITENEALAAGRSRQALAEEQAGKIREVLLASRDRQASLEPAAPAGLREILRAGIATALLIVVAVTLRFLFPRLLRVLEGWRGTRLRAVSFRGLELLSADHLTNGLLLLSRLFRDVIAVLALYLYLHFMLGLFPWTRQLETTMVRALASPLEHSEALRANLVSLFIGILLALIATGVFLALLKVIQQLFPRLLDAVSGWGRTRLPSLKIQRVELLSASQITEGLLGMMRVLRFVALAVVIYFYAASLLSFFPWTRQLSVELLGYVLEPVKTIGSAFASALPDVITIAIIVLITRYIIKLISLLFTGLERGAIRFAGFHREWAQPTYKIVRFLVIVFAAIAIFPYIPGSKSEGFRGISVFLGILISLGSASAIGNVVAGVVLTYMRPFRVGDRVKIADTFGDVTEKTLLVTRVRTIKNVDITIPNALVLSSHIINFSSSATNPPPLILHTSVTIGYDTPWRTVHELLVSAARATTHILPDPGPFVLQTTLNDFHVTYEINAYTDQPNLMATIYAELNQHIQDKFNEAGVEIMSPHYAQIRDGNKTTIPDEYLPKHYEAPGLRIWPLGSLRRHPEPPPSGEVDRGS